MAISLATQTLRAIMFLGCRGKPATNKHRMNKELSSFAARMRELIANQQSAIGNPQFSELALELFTLQFKHNSAYRKICEARNRPPQTIEHWTQIPCVPTAAFKELELTSIAPDERAAVFHSSGTTEQKPSRHFHGSESLAVYEASLWQWFHIHFGGSGDFLFLTPDKNAAPNSSLVHMFETVRRKSGLPESAFTGNISADGSWVCDFEKTIQRLKAACAAGKPLTLLGTAFSFVHLADYLAENDLQFQLPENSRVMETGGYKNRSRTMPKPELHALITKLLGIAPENIICEYGMSELSSQAYSQARGFGREALGKMIASPAPKALSPPPFCFPPWTRVQIISPETGREVAEGETGLIRVLDLANVFSVAAIQTEDLGIRRGHGFELIGRAQLAEPRGCSLMTA
jgi:hypothetical protein